jgi:hypothetical protein
MAAASDGEPGGNSNGLNLQKGPNLPPVTAADGNVPVLAMANGGKYDCQYYVNHDKSLTSEI